MIIDISNPETLKMCAVCISDTSGGQLALLVIVVSFTLLAVSYTHLTLPTICSV